MTAGGRRRRRADGDRDLGAATAAGTVSHLNGDVVLSGVAESHLGTRCRRALSATVEAPAVGEGAAVLARDRRVEGHGSSGRHCRPRRGHGDGEQWSLEHLDRDRQRLTVVRPLNFIQEVVVGLPLPAPAPRPVVLIQRSECLHDRSFLWVVEVGRALRGQVRRREHRTRSRLRSSLAIDHGDSVDGRDRNRSRQAAQDRRKRPRAVRGELDIHEPVPAELVHVGPGVRRAIGRSTGAVRARRSRSAWFRSASTRSRTRPRPSSDPPRRQRPGIRAHQPCRRASTRTAAPG